MYTYMTLVRYIKPYYCDKLNKLDAYSSLTTLITMILSLFYVGKVKIEDEKTLTAVFFFIVFINSLFILFWSFRIAPFIILQVVWFVRKYILRRRLEKEEIQIEEVKIEVIGPPQTMDHQADGQIKKEKQIIRNPLNFMKQYEKKFNFFEDSALSLKERENEEIYQVESEIEVNNIKVKDPGTKNKTKAKPKKKISAKRQKNLN